MIQIRCLKSAPQGNVDLLMRFIDKNIFIKIKNKQYLEQILSQLRQKGALIEMGKHGNWVKIDIFKDNEYIKLGNIEFNIKEKTSDEIEKIISNFYKEQYEKGGFIVEMQNVET